MDRRERLKMHIERIGPYAGGLVALICAAIWHSDISEFLTRSAINPKDAVASIFDVMVTLTAFLFTVFVLAIAPGGGFIEKIFGTRTFLIFKRYVVEALLLGAVAAGLSMPFMVTENIASGVWSGFWPQSIWLGLTVASILAFLRVVHIFMVWRYYIWHTQGE